MNPVFRGVFELAMAMLGIAVLTLLINRSGDTQTVIGAATGGFNALLRTLTLQGNSGSGISWGG